MVLALCMAFLTVAFEAEPEMFVTEVSDIQMYVPEMAGEVCIQTREPAAPISGATKSIFCRIRILAEYTQL